MAYAFGCSQVGLIISIGGMLVFALVVGIVAESISESIDGLRHGRTRVIESNHTILLNWSQAPPTASQWPRVRESHAPATPTGLSASGAPARCSSALPRNTAPTARSWMRVFDAT